MPRYHLPTFSSLGLAGHCAFPWSSGIEHPEVHANDAMRFGSAISTLAEMLAVWGDSVNIDAIAAQHELKPAQARDLADCKTHLLDQLERDGAIWREAEVAYSYDYETKKARRRGVRRGRDYSDCGRTEIPGTPDLVFRRADGTVVVRDWKTGTYTKGLNPAKYAQLRAIALCVSQVLGVDEIVVELAQVSPSGVFIRSGRLGPADWPLIAGSMAWTGLEAQSPTTQPRAGTHCAQKFCPIVTRCPAHAETAKQIGSGKLTTEFTSPQHAAEVRMMVDAAKRMLKDVESALEAYATTTPIPLPDGSLWTQVEKSRETISVNDDALALLLAEGYEDACTMTLTKAALSRAVKKSAPKGEAAQRQRAILESLQDCGAIAVKTYKTFGAVAPGKVG